MYHSPIYNAINGLATANKNTINPIPEYKLVFAAVLTTPSPGFSATPLELFFVLPVAADANAEAYKLVVATLRKANLGEEKTLLDVDDHSSKADHRMYLFRRNYSQVQRSINKGSSRSQSSQLCRRPGSTHRSRLCREADETGIHEREEGTGDPKGEAGEVEFEKGAGGWLGWWWDVVDGRACS